jgi:hypothetical protein
MAGVVWLVSHGGVGSEHLYDQLKLAYPDIYIRGRPLRGVVAHLPAPFRVGPRKCIYLFGAPIDAILSQLRRNYYDNPKKLRNDVLQPAVHSLDDLLSTATSDPFGINAQFRSFCRESADYPILMVNRAAVSRQVDFISKFAELGHSLTWDERQRKTSRGSVPPEALGELERLYGITEKIMDQMPDVVLRLPVWLTRYRYELDLADVVTFRALDAAKEFATWFLEARSGGCVDESRVRLKHAFEWTNESGERYSFVNVRHDIADTGWGSVGYLLCISYNTGEVTQVQHDEFVEDKVFSGAEDPRYFWRGKQLGVIFNALCRDGTRRMFMYFHDAKRCIKLHVPDFRLAGTEKNWSVFVIGEVIYLVYSFNPSIVFRLDDDQTGFCSVVSSNAAVLGGEIEPLYPYGGSTLSLWVWPYFVGLVHTRHPYRPAFIVFDVQELRVVAIGRPFSVPEPPAAVPWRGRDVQYPYHLDVSKGACDVWIECQDRCPTQYRFDFGAFCEVISTLIAVQPCFGGAVDG